MGELELKLYSEISEIFDEIGLSTVNEIANNDRFAWQWATDWRWNIFGYALDDELLFDYTDVEQLQDYAYRYLQHKLNED